MDFSIVTDTAGASVSELGSALRELLVDKINKKYEKYNISIGCYFKIGNNGDS